MVLIWYVSFEGMRNVTKCHIHIVYPALKGTMSLSVHQEKKALVSKLVDTLDTHPSVSPHCLLSF